MTMRSKAPCGDFKELRKNMKKVLMSQLNLQDLIGTLIVRKAIWKKLYYLLSFQLLFVLMAAVSVSV